MENIQGYSELYFGYHRKSPKTNKGHCEILQCVMKSLSDRFESRKNLNIVKRRDRDQLRNDRGLNRGELMKIIGEKLAGVKQNE